MCQHLCFDGFYPFVLPSTQWHHPPKSCSPASGVASAMPKRFTGTWWRADGDGAFLKGEGTPKMDKHGWFINDISKNKMGDFWGIPTLKKLHIIYIYNHIHIYILLYYIILYYIILYYIILYYIIYEWKYRIFYVFVGYWHMVYSCTNMEVWT